MITHKSCWNSNQSRFVAKIAPDSLYKFLVSSTVDSSSRFSSIKNTTFHSMVPKSSWLLQNLEGGREGRGGGGVGLWICSVLILGMLVLGLGLVKLMGFFLAR